MTDIASMEAEVKEFMLQVGAVLISPSQARNTEVLT